MISRVYFGIGLNDLDITGLSAGTVLSIFVVDPGHDGGPGWPCAAYSDVANPDPRITQLDYIDGNPVNTQGYLFIYIADGVATNLHFEPLFGSGNIISIGYDGVDNTTPCAGFVGIAGNGTSVAVSSLSTTTDGSVITWLALTDNSYSTSPSDGTNIYSTVIDPTTSPQLSFRPPWGYEFFQSTAGSTGTVTATITGPAAWIAGMIALNPASGGDIGATFSSNTVTFVTL